MGGGSVLDAEAVRGARRQQLQDGAGRQKIGKSLVRDFDVSVRRLSGYAGGASVNGKMVRLLHCDCSCDASVGAAAADGRPDLLVGQELEEAAHAHGDDCVVAAAVAFDRE